MKVGDLVKFVASQAPARHPQRNRGIVVSFDNDNDPVVLWLGSGWNGYREANFRNHIVVLSEAQELLTAPRQEGAENG